MATSSKGRTTRSRSANTGGAATSGGGKLTAQLTDEQLLTVWSKAVDTQMHFNEMCVKSRQLGLTFVAAALGVGVVLLGRGDDFALPFFFGLKLDVTVLLILAGLLALLAVRKLDLGVYHQMLRGSVAFGRDIEGVRLAGLTGVNKGMTEAITFTSQNKDVCTSGVPFQYTGIKDKTAEAKVRSFYNTTATFLGIAAVLLAIATNWPKPAQSPKMQPAKQGQAVLNISAQVTAPATATVTEQRTQQPDANAAADVTKNQ